MRIAIIPARGGSVRVPRKNIREFRGKPMLHFPIDTARESDLFDLIVVSTDDEEIAATAFKRGATVVPREADDGTAGTQDVAAGVLEKLGARSGYACVIYATTPLLDAQLLGDGYRALHAPRSKPFAYSVGPDGTDAGTYYWGWTHAFRSGIPLERGTRVMLPADRVCDINTWDDWSRAESMFDALRRAS